MLDAGDLFQNKYKVQEERWGDVDRTARFLVDQYNASGLAAMVLGDRDTVLGLHTLQELHKAAKFPFLTANLVDVNTGQPLFDSHVIREVSGTRVGIFGVTMSSTARLDTFTKTRPWRVDDFVQVARQEVAALKKEGAELIIALAHLADPDLERLARDVDGIHAVLGGNGVQLKHHPTFTNGAYVAGAHTRGKYLSTLVFHTWKGKETDRAYVDRDRRQGIERRIEQSEARISNYTSLIQREEEARQEASEQAAKTGVGRRGRKAEKNLEFYRKQLVKFQAEKQMLSMELEETAKPDPRANFVTYELIPVDKDIEDESTCAGAVTAFRAEVPKL